MCACVCLCPCVCICLGQSAWRGLLGTKKKFNPVDRKLEIHHYECCTVHVLSTVLTWVERPAHNPSYIFYQGALQ